jgi:hypothetical protein
VELELEKTSICSKRKKKLEKKLNLKEINNKKKQM